MTYKKKLKKTPLKAKQKPKTLTKGEKFLRACRGHWVRVMQLDAKNPRAGIVCNLTKLNGVKLLFLDTNEPEIRNAPIRDITGVGPEFEYNKASTKVMPDCGDPSCSSCEKTSAFKDYELQ